ncbi:MAG: DUF2922 domain-containing protein [Synergistaceae bacterium]|jgi:hypothetical protein|nr:DUF2922 domain-containing protein [Synergistaceae bacterium]
MSAKTNTLCLRFDTQEGKIATININNCKLDLTVTEVSDAMDDLIDSGIFASGLLSKRDAKIIERTVTELF